MFFDIWRGYKYYIICEYMLIWLYTRCFLKSCVAKKTYIHLCIQVHLLRDINADVLVEDLHHYKSDCHDKLGCKKTYIFYKWRGMNTDLTEIMMDLHGLILCWSLLPDTSGWERWSQSFTEMRSIEVKDAMIIARCLMCEATMTNNTGLNSIISWVVWLNINDRKSPFHHGEYSCRSEPVVADLCLHLSCNLDITASAY